MARHPRLKPLRLELLPPHRPPRLAWALPAVLLVAALAVAAQAWSLQLRRQRLDADFARWQSQGRTPLAASAALPPAAASQAQPPYAADARLALHEARFAAGGGLASIEQADVPGVRPVAVELMGSADQLRLEVEFGEHAELLRYLAALNGDAEPPRFSLLQTRREAPERRGQATLQASFAAAPP